MIRHLPFFFSGMTEHRSLPAIADVPFRDRFREIAQPAGAKEKAAFYAGCLVDFAYPGIGESVVKVLNAAGVEVTFPRGPDLLRGPGPLRRRLRRGRAQRHGQREGPRGPGRALDRVGLPDLHRRAPARVRRRRSRPRGTPTGRSGPRRVASKVRDFSSLVKELVDAGRLTVEAAKGLEAVTYHDSCHLKRKLNAHEPPRQLLGAAGFELKEMKDSDSCCGMGGSYSLKFPEISAPILARKLENIRATGVETVAMDCPGCMLQIGGGLDLAGRPPPAPATSPISSPTRSGRRPSARSRIVGGCDPRVRAGCTHPGSRLHYHPRPRLPGRKLRRARERRHPMRSLVRAATSRGRTAGPVVVHGTKMVQTWRDPKYQAQPVKRIFIVCVMPSDAARVTFENTLAQALLDKGFLSATLDRGLRVRHGRQGDGAPVRAGEQGRPGHRAAA